MSAKRLPTRSEVSVSNTWDLATLFATDEAWETAFAEWEAMVPGYAIYAGTLGTSVENVAALLRFDARFERAGDKLGTYAFLKETEDVANSKYQGLKARYIGIAGRAAEAASYYRPELLAIPDDTMREFIASPVLADYKLWLERLLRYKPHTLSMKEERILAMQTETTQTPRNVFDQLTDADMRFGTIETAENESIELSHSTYSMMLESPDRAIREVAFHQYYVEYSDHANTLAATLAGSVKQDVYQSRVRNYPSAREAALFPDVVPVSVYDNLLSAVRANLPAVHQYYDVRKRAMKLDDIHFYDVYVPILTEFQRKTTWDEGVELVLDALKPLGSDYGNVLATGMRGRWCDRGSCHGGEEGRAVGARDRSSEGQRVRDAAGPTRSDLGSIRHLQAGWHGTRAGDRPADDRRARRASGGVERSGRGHRDTLFPAGERRLNQLVAQWY